MSSMIMYASFPFKDVVAQVTRDMVSSSSEVSVVLLKCLGHLAAHMNDQWFLFMSGVLRSEITVSVVSLGVFADNAVLEKTKLLRSTVIIEAVAAVGSGAT